METTDDYRFWVSLSQQKFDHKPDRITEVGKLKFTRIYTDIEGFAEGIAKGYCYAPIFKSATFSMGEKTDKNFDYSSFISLDIDHSKTDMNTLIENIKFRPTVAYTSCSNGLDGEYSYRLIYCFTDKLTSNEEYSNYVYTVLNANEISIDEIDKRSLKASQYYNGNGCGNIETNVSDIVYSKNDFIDYYKDYSINKINNKSININHIQPPPTIMSYVDTFENKQFENDFWSMRMEDILSKYVEIYPNLEHSELPKVDDDTPYILLPKDYIEIRRWWRIKNNGSAIKIKDGQQRRYKLFMNGIIRRLINPNITFDNLLYNMLYELVYYISNFDAENIIGKKEIYNIARSVMKKDIAQYEGLKGTKRVFIVNPNYCIKHGISKKKARAIASYALGNGDRIGELYDCSLTDKKNVEVMKQYGLDISLSSLKRWRVKNGITKYKKKQ